MRSRLIVTILALVLTPTLVACNKKDEAATKAADPKKPADPGAKPADPGAKPADPGAKPAAAALVDHDLASRGAAWAGWSIKGPQGATLAADEGTFAGATAMRWDNGMGGVGFKQGKLDFAFLKKEVFTIGKTTVTKDTPDLIEVTMEFAGTPVQCFYANYKVGDVDVGCWTTSCVQTGAELATAREICASLTKK